MQGERQIEAQTHTQLTLAHTADTAAHATRAMCLRVCATQPSASVVASSVLGVTVLPVISGGVPITITCNNMVCQSNGFSATSNGDPHIKFAHGGVADMRGEHSKRPSRPATARRLCVTTRTAVCVPAGVC